ncbi:MAG: sigma-70 family RNA polymerase sigma factor [Phormidesmis sp.]
MDAAPLNRPDYSTHSAPPDSLASSPTDAELWFALRAGQTEALGDLYDRHAGLVYGVSLKVLGNTQEAEDLTQDIFIKLAERASYDPTRGSLRTFLMILTRSRAIDRVRSRQSAQRSKQRWQADYAPSTAEPLAQGIVKAEQSSQVQAALSQISAQQREVLQMAYYDGLTQAAIAERLNAPLGTVKARARRGLLKLREILQDCQESRDE